MYIPTAIHSAVNLGQWFDNIGNYFSVIGIRLGEAPGRAFTLLVFSALITLPLLRNRKNGTIAALTGVISFIGVYLIAWDLVSPTPLLATEASPGALWDQSFASSAGRWWALVGFIIGLLAYLLSTEKKPGGKVLNLWTVVRGLIAALGAASFVMLVFVLAGNSINPIIGDSLNTIKDGADTVLSTLQP